jgi:hypothetical protein
MAALLVILKLILGDRVFACEVWKLIERHDSSFSCSVFAAQYGQHRDEKQDERLIERR